MEQARALVGALLYTKPSLPFRKLPASSPG